MDISIIIVNFNTKALLKRCLESTAVSCELSTINGEVIVVDNGSTDGSIEMVKSMVRGSVLKMHLIENESNLGFAKAVNQALRQVYTERSRSAEGEVFLLLNSDTQIKTGALKELLDFEEKVKPAVIGARMLSPDGSVQGSCFYLPTVERAIDQYWFGGKKYFEKYFPEGSSPVEVEAVSGGAMLISKGVINKIGLLDERYFMYFEDLDFCRRAKKAGFKIYYLPSAEIIHEHGASGKHLADLENQWKRLIPSSKTYHGLLRYYIIGFIIKTGQKIRKKC